MISIDGNDELLLEEEHIDLSVSNYSVIKWSYCMVVLVWLLSMVVYLVSRGWAHFCAECYQ